MKTFTALALLVLIIGRQALSLAETNTVETFLVKSHVEWKNPKEAKNTINNCGTIRIEHTSTSFDIYFKTIKTRQKSCWLQFPIQIKRNKIKIRREQKK